MKRSAAIGTKWKVKITCLGEVEYVNIVGELGRFADDCNQEQSLKVSEGADVYDENAEAV